jgi:hypothetical protein
VGGESDGSNCQMELRGNPSAVSKNTNENAGLKGPAFEGLC